MDAAQVKPRQKLLALRGREFLLTAMSGAPLLDWAEIQVLSARQKIEAAQRLRQGRESDLRECLVQLLCADLSLVTRATGCDIAFANELSIDERRQVVHSQDVLNQTLDLAPLMTGQAMTAWVDTVAQ